MIYEILKEYMPLKTPEDMSEGLLFSFATSKQLDIFGEMVNIKRRKIGLFKEPDRFYKVRLRNEGIRKLLSS